MNSKDMSIEDLIPHRGRMKLIDDIIEMNENGAVTRSVVNETWPFFDDKSVNPIVLIELLLTNRLYRCQQFPALPRRGRTATCLRRWWERRRPAHRVGRAIDTLTSSGSPELLRATTRVSFQMVPRTVRYFVQNVQRRPDTLDPPTQSEGNSFGCTRRSMSDSHRINFPSCYRHMLLSASTSTGLLSGNGVACGRSGS